MMLRVNLVALFALSGVLLSTAAVAAPASKPATQPVPALQVLPVPYDQASFTRDGLEIARYHFGPTLQRPFLYPLMGPSGRSLTRMGHPRDPTGHSHHNSIWISHHDVNGISFWSDRRVGVIAHQKIEAYEDEGAAGEVGSATAAIRSLNHWLTPADNKIQMVERRQTRIELLPDNELLVLIDLQLEAPPRSQTPVTLGKTPFGIIGVRMAKTIGTHDGGGTIRNSEGGVNEKEIFWKTARWVDYSGPITNTAIEGVTLMDHPSNPGHPTGFHVRGDGWMGAALTLNDARIIEPGKPMKLRYGLYVHNGMPDVKEIDAIWEKYSRTKPPEDLTPKKK